jgi:hypothetical protein
MDQYPFEFTLTLLLDELYELQDLLDSRSRDNELFSGISEELTNQLNEQLKNF